MSYNSNNFGILTGRMTANFKSFPNSDGSQKLRGTIAVRDNFPNRKGEYGSQFIPVEAFIAKDKPLGVYERIHAGDAVTFTVSMRNNNYTDKATGATVYGMILQIESVALHESRAVVEARLAARESAGDQGTAGYEGGSDEEDLEMMACAADAADTGDAE